MRASQQGSGSKACSEKVFGSMYVPSTFSERTRIVGDKTLCFWFVALLRWKAESSSLSATTFKPGT